MLPEPDTPSLRPDPGSCWTGAGRVPPRFFLLRTAPQVKGEMTKGGGGEREEGIEERGRG